MENEILENIELESVIAPNDDDGDLISVLFQAGFSEEETDIVFEAISDMKNRPFEDVVVDEEIAKISDQFEINNFELNDEDLSVIRAEVTKRFKL